MRRLEFAERAGFAYETTAFFLALPADDPRWVELVDSIVREIEREGRLNAMREGRESA